MRFAVTGSGRCGTRYMSKLLTAAGVPCGHEEAFGIHGAGLWTLDRQADSSWMAATMLDQVDVPVVLLVRHPLAVVRSWVEIGFFSHDHDNPTHTPLLTFAPGVYAYDSPADRALAMWCALNAAALPRAELLLRLELLDAAQLGRLLQWAGADPAKAGAAFRKTGRTNRHEGMRAKVRIRHEPTWGAHHPELAHEAQELARLLGYDPEVISGG